jgi:RNA-directed DNA polymerase
MTEVRTSSLCERPCAGIEETGEAPSDAGGMECSRRRKVHSLIDKVYDPANLAEAWKRVRENKGSAGIDGLTVAGFEQRQDELLEGLHKQLREKTYRPSPVKRVAIPKLGKRPATTTVRGFGCWHVGLAIVERVLAVVRV